MEFNWGDIEAQVVREGEIIPEGISYCVPSPSNATTLYPSWRTMYVRKGFLIILVRCDQDWNITGIEVHNTPVGFEEMKDLENRRNYFHDVDMTKNFSIEA